MFDSSAITRNYLLDWILKVKDFKINEKEKETLRSLAGKLAEIAAKPEQKEKRELWYKLNSLEATRPLIFCAPENGWHEVIRWDSLECENGLARIYEWLLRREIFWGESMGDDKPIEPYFNIPYVITESDWGMSEILEGGENGGAYHMISPLEDYSKDFDKLHFPEINIDHEMTDKLVNAAKECFGDLLVVRAKKYWFAKMVLTDVYAKLRGLDKIMFDMYDYPDEIHRMMAFLRDGFRAKLDYFEKNNMLDINSGSSYAGSGGLAYSRELPHEDFDGKKVRTQDMWGFSENQVTGNVSMEMFKEFIYPYQLSLLESFGLNSYGCCEPIDQRWDVVKNIPRLRRVSVSPWANLQAMADNLKDKFIYSLKPIPTDLAVPNMNENVVRKKLRDGLKIARDCRVEIIMKDNHTIANNPQNLIRWCQIAREEIERI